MNARELLEAIKRRTVQLSFYFSFPLFIVAIIAACFHLSVFWSYIISGALFSLLYFLGWIIILTLATTIFMRNK